MSRNHVLANSNPEPEWQYFLRLGEHLAQQSNAAAQAESIVQLVQSEFSCLARLWLARPFYPLPGEPEPLLLPDDHSPEIVRLAFEKHSLMCQSGSRTRPTGLTSRSTPTCLAIPLMTQGDQLGVLYVERADDHPLYTNEVELIRGLCAHAAISLQMTRQSTLKNWRYEQLSLVRTVSEQIANVLDLDTLCRRVSELIQSTFKLYYVAIFTFENDERTLRNRAGASADATTHSDMENAQAGEGIIGLVGQDGIELIVPDVSLEPGFIFEKSLSLTRSEAALPLKVGDRVLGVLDVQSDQIDGFHSAEILVLRALADNVALAVDSARMYTDLQQRAEQMATVYEVNHALNSILDPDELLEEVVRLLRKRFKHPYMHLFTVQSGRRKIVFRVGSGARSAALRDNPAVYDLDAEKGIIPHVARTGKTLLSNDVTLEPLYVPSTPPPDNTCSELAVPIIFTGEVLGVLDIQSDRCNAFSSNDQTLFESLAAGIAIAMRNATLYRTERWRHQVADSFSDVATLITTNISLESLLDTILTELERNLPCDSSAIWLLDSTAEDAADPEPQLRLAAVHGVDASKTRQITQEQPEVRTWLYGGLKGTQSSIRKPTDAYGPLGAAGDYPEDYSSIAVPLRANDTRLGVLTLAHQTPGRYGSEARAMTTTFANYAAVAIQNARLFTAAQEQAWVSTALLQVSEATQSLESLDDLLATMVRLIPVLAGVEKCALFLWEEARGGFILKSWYGLENPFPSMLYTEENTPAFARLRNKSNIMLVQSTEIALEIADDPNGLVMVPLLARGSLMGAYLVGQLANGRHGAERGYNDRILQILQGVAHQTSVMIENLRLTEASQEEAYVTAALLQVAQAVVSQNEISDILATIVQLMPILVGVDTCAIYLWDKVHGVFVPSQVYTDTHEMEKELSTRAFSRKEFDLLHEVAEHDELFVCQMPDPNLPFAEWAQLESTPVEQIDFSANPEQSAWLMGFPLSVKNEVFGVLVARDSSGSGSVQERRIEIITGIAQQTSLAIQNERLNQETVDRERMEREFQLARDIQQTFLPDHLPTFDGWDFDSRWQTARQVGGDFYDIFTLPDNRVGLVIADVSDKGLPAALYMTVTRTLIRANVQGNRSPSTVLKRVNQQLHNNAPNGMFITGVYAILSLKTGEMVYCNAGHNRPLLLNKQSNRAEPLQKGGIALGVLSHIELTDHTITIQPGDGLVFYTDGVTESFSPTSEAFGEERLEDVLSAASYGDICQILDKLDQELLAFRNNTPPSDDVTILAFQRLKEQFPISD